jgi:hypothetical protein
MFCWDFAVFQQGAADRRGAHAPRQEGRETSHP